MKLGTVPDSPYKEFVVLAMTESGTEPLNAFPVKLQYMGAQILCISTKNRGIYLTREQARAFFGFPQD